MARTPVETQGAPAVRKVGRTAAWIAKQVELGLEEVGLSLPQYRVLSLLDAGPEISSALADRLAVRPPSVTAVVDGLVARDLVERSHLEDDRRRVSHVLTASGRYLLASADEAVERRLVDICRCLPDERSASSAIENMTLWGEALRAYRDREVEQR